MLGTSELETSAISVYNEPFVGSCEINQHHLSVSRKIQVVSTLLRCLLEKQQFSNITLF